MILRLYTKIKICVSHHFFFGTVVMYSFSRQSKNIFELCNMMQTKNFYTIFLSVSNKNFSQRKIMRTSCGKKFCTHRSSHKIFLHSVHQIPIAFFGRENKKIAAPTPFACKNISQSSTQCVHDLF